MAVPKAETLSAEMRKKRAASKGMPAALIRNFAKTMLLWTVRKPLGREGCQIINVNHSVTVDILT